MGQTGSSQPKVRQHVETAAKTGALVLIGCKLQEVNMKRMEFQNIHIKK